MGDYSQPSFGQAFDGREDRDSGASVRERERRKCKPLWPRLDRSGTGRVGRRLADFGCRNKRGTAISLKEVVLAGERLPRLRCLKKLPALALAFCRDGPLPTFPSVPQHVFPTHETLRRTYLTQIRRECSSDSLTFGSTGGVLAWVPGGVRTTQHGRVSGRGPKRVHLLLMVLVVVVTLGLPLRSARLRCLARPCCRCRPSCEFAKTTWAFESEMASEHSRKASVFITLC
jgi:hypothetical protein